MDRDKRIRKLRCKRRSRPKPDPPVVVKPAKREEEKKEEKKEERKEERKEKGFNELEKERIFGKAKEMLHLLELIEVCRSIHFFFLFSFFFHFHFFFSFSFPFIILSFFK